MTCENCGLPDWAISHDGVTLKLRVKGDKWKRDSNRKVWCCSEACKWQTIAVAQMGPASHKWPVSLAEFISQEKRSGRHETPKRNSDSKAVTGAISDAAANDPSDLVFVTNRGGRPRKWKSDAERASAYRNRKRQGELPL